MKKLTEKDIDISWNITDCHAIPNHKTMRNFIESVEYTVSATLKKDTDKTVVIGGIAKFELPTKKDKNFINISKLSESTVIEWVKTSVGERNVLQGLLAHMTRELSPPTISIKLKK